MSDENSMLGVPARYVVTKEGWMNQLSHFIQTAPADATIWVPTQEIADIAVSAGRVIRPQKNLSFAVSPRGVLDEPGAIPDIGATITRDESGAPQLNIPGEAPMRMTPISPEARALYPGVPTTTPAQARPGIFAAHCGVLEEMINNGYAARLFRDTFGDHPPLRVVVEEPDPVRESAPALMKELVEALEEVLKTGLNGGNNVRLALLAASQDALKDEDLERGEKSEAAVERAHKALKKARQVLKVSEVVTLEGKVGNNGS